MNCHKMKEGKLLYKIQVTGVGADRYGRVSRLPDGF